MSEEAPKSIFNLIVEMVEPFNGRVYAIDGGSLFVSREKFTKEHLDLRAEYMMANPPAFVRRWVRDRNAEALRTQSSCPRISSAPSVSPRFKPSQEEVACA